MNKINAVKIFCNTFLISSDEEINKIVSEVSHLVIKEKKEIFFFEGTEGKHVYFLIEGLIRLYKTNNEGKEAVIHFVHSGEIFAEILLYLNNKYPVTAMAVENCTALAIDSSKLFEIIKEKPAVAMKLIGALAKRIKYFVNMVENLTLSDVSKRFLNYLRMLQDKSKSDEIMLPIKKGDIALLLGAVPETFSRILKRLSDDGIIQIDGRKVKILKPLE